MTTDPAIVRVVDQIKKSDIDTWNYRGLELENGMLCVLISHSDIDKAAAALNVEIGSFADPIDVLGIAHFLEHMLFMGSTKVIFKFCSYTCIFKGKIILFSFPMKMAMIN